MHSYRTKCLEGVNIMAERGLIFMGTRNHSTFGDPPFSHRFPTVASHNKTATCATWRWEGGTTKKKKHIDDLLCCWKSRNHPMWFPNSARVVLWQVTTRTEGAFERSYFLMEWWTVNGRLMNTWGVDSDTRAYKIVAFEIKVWNYKQLGEEDIWLRPPFTKLTGFGCTNMMFNMLLSYSEEL